MRCCLLFSGRIFNPANLLNHVAPSIELIMQMIVSNLIGPLIITASCNNLEHLHLTQQCGDMN